MAYAQDKVAAVMADLMMGMSYRKAAEKHGVTHPTVMKWAENLPELTTKKEENFRQLVDGFLREAFVTFTTHLRYAQDEEWFKSHDPDKVAIFDGTYADKVFRALDSIASSQRAIGKEATEQDDQPDRLHASGNATV